MSPASTLPFETIAIVNDMLGELDARQPAIMLRMWHHLSSSQDREKLFGAFSDEAPMPLVQSFFGALRLRVQARWPQLRPPPGLCDDGSEALVQAFEQAVADVLGPRANRIVLNAWTLTLRDFIAEMCRCASAPEAPASAKPAGPVRGSAGSSA